MPNRDARLDLLAGAIGDKYEILRLIGSGGMGSVFAARHRLHGGMVAVKVLAGHLAANAEVVRRFLQEARSLALLSGHPRILSVIDVEERKGLYVLIMPYLEGEDLSAYLKKRGRLSFSEACAVGAQVADGLAFAHAKGVIHRDLKPANLCYQRRPGGHSGFRDRQSARRRHDLNTHRCCLGDPTLHGARADPRQALRWPNRPLRVWRDSL